MQTIVLAVLSLHFGVGVCLADNDELSIKIKVGYLYNFTKFIKWPDSPASHFNVCLLGPTPFGGMLASLEDKVVASKPIRIIKLDSLQDKADCQMLYLDALDSLPKTWLQDPAKAGLIGNPLTVSSQAGFVEMGGMIGFVIIEDKVKLRINLKSLQNSGLSVSAKLLEVATLFEGSNDE